MFESEFHRCYRGSVFLMVLSQGLKVKTQYKDEAPVHPGESRVLNAKIGSTE